MSRHRAVDVGDGTCVTCGRALVDYGSGPQHRRGRIAGVSPFRAKTQVKARRYPAWKLAILRSEDTDRCECGTPLDQHEPLPRVRVRSEQAKRARQLEDSHVDSMMARRSDRQAAFGRATVMPQAVAA